MWIGSRQIFIGAAAVMMALPAYADPPVVHYAHDEFVGVNPCTGLEHTVTIDSTHLRTGQRCQPLGLHHHHKFGLQWHE